VRLTRNRRGVEEIPMKIKEFVYSAQKHIEAHTDEKFKRTHIYELLAASFNYNSFAALCAESILFHDEQLPKYEPHNLALRQRCVELGYTPATADFVFDKLPAYIVEQKITLVNISELISRLREELFYQDEHSEWNTDNYDDEIEDNTSLHQSDEDYERELSPELLAELEIAAEKGNLHAHYALALSLAPDDDYEQNHGSDYWYTQQQQGRVLTGIEKEWADNYSQSAHNIQKYEFHLREAARLGDERAQLDLAENFNDPLFFEQPTKENTHDPLRVVEIAEDLDRLHDVHIWLTIAAKAGDINAMTRLIEEFDQDDLQRCWTWIYLAQLLKTDLTKDNHYAIHENGSHYDDDVGGNMYVGGQEGIKLPPLSEEQDILAHQNAQSIYKKDK